MKKLWFKKNSKVHGSGLFATTNIKKGTPIIEYIGDKVTKKEGDRRADIQIQKAKRHKKNGMVYVFELNKKYNNAITLPPEKKPSKKIIIWLLDSMF